MDLEKLMEKLVAAARNDPPGDQVPPGFERRLMARLLEVALPDPWILWSQALWRAAIPCILILIFSGLWSARTSPAGATDLSQQIENTVLSELNHNLASVW